MQSGLKIRLLGTFEVEGEESILPRLQRQKTKWLLALLVLRHGKPVERTRLANLLWPDDLEPRNNLNNSVNDLRRALGRESARLITTTHTLAFDLTGADVDLIAFDAGIRATNIGTLTEAVTLYTGPLLEDCADAWVQEERQRRQAAYLKAVQKLAQHALEDEDHPRAISWLKQIAWVDLSQQDIHRSLMQTLSRTGAFTAAMEVYYELRSRLHSASRPLPDGHTTDLYRQIWQNAREQAARSSAVTPPPSSQAPPCRIPRRGTALLGRRSELATAMAAVLRERLVTLTGYGGVGKTSLGIEVAIEAYPNFRHGAIFVDLATITDPRQLAQQIAITLECPKKPAQPWEETLLSFLETRQMLLMLDNCEQIVPACAALVRQFLARCPQVHLLCTSRERLGLSSETLISLAPLATPDQEGASELQSCLSHPAVQLFCERAKAIRSDFEPTSNNIAQIVQIVRLLEGLPLAIELAAPLVELLPLSDIITRLVEDRFQLLNSRETGSTERHSSLRHVVESSIEHLSQAEQNLLSHLCTFSGGCTLEAMEALITPRHKSAELLPLLSQLMFKSLIYSIQDEAHGHWRYAMLETTRQYGIALLTSSRWASIQRTHADYFARYAEQAAIKLAGAEQATWLNRLDAEIGNLRTALIWSTQQEEDTAIAYRLGGALWRFFHLRSYHDEGQVWLEEIVRLPAEEPTVRLQALLGLGNMLFVLGDHLAATKHFKECEQIAVAVKDVRVQATAIGGIANIEMAAGHCSQARHLFKSSVTLLEALDDRRLAAMTYANLAMIEDHEGNYEQADSLYCHAISLSRQVGDRYNVAQASNNFANTMLKWTMRKWTMLKSREKDGTETARLRFLLEESLVLSQELGSPRLLCQCLSNYRRLAQTDCDWKRAGVLIGAETALHQKFALVLPRIAREQFAVDEESIRNNLGEETFLKCHRQGSEMTRSEMFAFAGDTETSHHPAPWQGGAERRTAQISPRSRQPE